MSVINQMLKDLERRAPGANDQINQTLTPINARSTVSVVIITVLTLLIIGSVGFYVWQLNNENKLLKAEQSRNKRDNTADVAKNVPKNIEMESISAPSANNLYTLNGVIESQPELTEPKNSATEQANEKILQKIAAKTLANNNVSKVTPAKQKAPVQDTHEHTHPHTQEDPQPKKATVDKKSPIAKSTAEVKANKNLMSVSRRQMSATELAQQKLALAEKALVNKEITKAEGLLEDVVIITPHDSQTRKKLAALWFGRQAYQDALNILSQGIALDSQDSSLREMKARIHLKQGQVNSALNTLKPLANLKDEQYQVMLASTAQKAQHHGMGVHAYKMLIEMQPDIGRWQMGLAVLYDKNSQFEQASAAYKMALTKNDLSVSSEQFVKQRIQAIKQ